MLTVLLLCWSFTPYRAYTQPVRDPDSTIARLKNEILLDPTSGEAFRRLADAFWFANRLEEGGRFWQSALQRNPNSHHYLEGETRFHQKSAAWQTCFESGQQALQLGSRSPQLLDSVVDCAVKSGRTSELAATLRKLRRSRTQRHLFDLGYAMWRLRVKNLPKARTTVEKYTTERGGDGYGYKILGEIELEMGNGVEAISAFTTARDLLPLTSDAGIDALAGLGAGYELTDDPDSSLYYLGLARKLAKVTGALDQVLGLSLREIGVYSRLGLFGKVRRTCREAVSIATTLRDSSSLGTLFGELGQTEAIFGNHARAVAHFRRGLEMATATHNTAERAKLHLETALAFRALGQPDSARTHIDTGFKIAGENGHEGIAQHILLTLADLQREAGDRAGANINYRAVLRYAQRAQDHELTETCFVKLSQLFLDAPRDLAAAEHFLNLGDALARQTFNLQFAANHRWLQGNLAWLTGEVEEAETRFLQARLLGAESGSYVACMAGQAGLVRTYLNADFADLAVAQADSGLNYVERYYDFVVQELAAEFFNLREDFFVPAINAYARVGDLKKIYRTVEQYKAIQHYVDIRAVRHEISSPVLDSLNWAIQLQRQAIGTEWKKLRELLQEGLDNPDLVKKMQGKIATRHQQQFGLFQEVANSNPKLASILHWRVPPLEDVQAQLRELKSTLLQYFVAETATFVTVVTADQIYCKRINTTRENLANLVAQIDSRLRLPGLRTTTSGETTAGEFRLDAAAELQGLVFEPIQDLISPDTELLISPSGVLNVLPFELLVLNPDELVDDYDYGNARYLIEAFPISYLPLTSFLTGGPGGKSTNSASNGRGDNLEPEAGQVGVPRGMSSSADPRPFDSVFRNPSTLRGLKGNQEFLHFAKSSVYRDDSALYSALPYKQDDKIDSLLVSTIFDTPLDGKLVVIDGMTRVLASNPDRVGSATLLHAFWFAGIPSLLVSQWQSGQEEREQLLTEFYDKVRHGVSKPRALQQAKVVLLQAKKRNPKYWAGLTLHGDPRAVGIRSSHTDRLIYLGAIGVFILAVILVVRFRQLRLLWH